MSVIKYAAASVGLWELFWWGRRRYERERVFDMAQAKAHELGRPLVVVGAPDQGATSGPGCGDITVDIAPSRCPGYLHADITQLIPLPDNSVVVYVSCVLEYVDDYDGAMRELERISGGHLYIVRVEPWTLTAYLYPGAKRTLPSPR